MQTFSDEQKKSQNEIISKLNQKYSSQINNTSPQVNVDEFTLFKPLQSIEKKKIK
jgi:hypothetical protein